MKDLLKKKEHVNNKNEFPKKNNKNELLTEKELLGRQCLKKKTLVLYILEAILFQQKHEWR